jgi:hypothetical protein|tara:strand:- start:53 stop:328 length:276 start_codon:yes stop_codon:yes gene_type:complete
MNFKKAVSILKVVIIITLFFWLYGVFEARAEPPKSNAKFYDFSEQVIDGQIKRPTALYTDARQKVKFDRLLKLKKSFLPEMLKTAKDPIFK